jgi:hypothetical protein
MAARAPTWNMAFRPSPDQVVRGGGQLGPQLIESDPSEAQANAETLKTTQSERDATRHNPNGVTQDISMIGRTIAPLHLSCSVVSV